MKKIILTLFFSAMAICLHAQWSGDVRVGLNLSGFTEGDATMKFGFKIAANGEYGFTERFALRSGLAFSKKGVTDGDNPFDFSPGNTVILNYLEIPLMASVKFPVSDGFSLALNAGPYFAWRINDKPAALPDMDTFDTGIGAGLDFNIGRGFVVGAEAQYGFKKLSETNKKPRNFNYTLSIGYRF